MVFDGQCKDFYNLRIKYNKVKNMSLLLLEGLKNLKKVINGRNDFLFINYYFY